ncbi:hypothetical protein, partial [Desulfofundulus thermocisternus]|uniref:hypothetical protein n=1 Tax=Desulfofundulus thermocisternus TaxID=42471 RepID=UPI00217D44C7
TVPGRHPAPVFFVTTPQRVYAGLLHYSHARLVPPSFSVTSLQPGLPRYFHHACTLRFSPATLVVYIFTFVFYTLSFY